MKYCAECGNEIQEDERFCSNCGTPVSSDSSEDNANKKHLVAMEEQNKGNENEVTLEKETSKNEESSEEPKQADNNSSGSSKDGCIGCLVLIVIIVLIFKGCGLLFGSDDEKHIKQPNYYNSTNKYSTDNNARSFDSYRPDLKVNASTYEVMLWRCTYCGEMRITHRYDGSPAKPSNAKRCPSSTLADQSHFWMLSRHKVYGWNPNSRQWVIMTDMTHS